MNENGPSDHISQQDPMQTMPGSSGQPGQAGAPGLAVAGFVLGIIAAATSFLPIINNASFFIGIVGLVLAIVGYRQVKSGARRGGGMAVAGIVLSLVAIVVTLLVQVACSAALDSVTANGAGSVSGAPAAASSGAGGEGAVQADTANMAIGQTIDMEDGLSVTVNSVETGLENYDGSTVACVTVTYVNNGTSNASFNMFDWKAQDADGAQRTDTFYAEGENNLNSGTLSPGGTVTGNAYFDEPIVKVFYYSNLLSSDSSIAWNVA